jgi:hypothetical protein
LLLIIIKRRAFKNMGSYGKILPVSGLADNLIKYGSANGIN